MWLGDYPVSFTAVTIMFTTHAADGSSVAPSTAFESADVDLFKDGSDAERTSQSGWTMTSPFNSTTGLHCLKIDLSDNSDAGFYAAGHVYTAVLTPDETVAGLTVAKVIGQFGIDLLGVKADTAAILVDTGTTLDAKIDTIDTNVDSILADTGTDGVVLINDAITAAKIAADAIGASELAADAANEIADAILNRDMSTGTDSGSTTVRTARQALRAIRNKTTIAAGTLTVYKEDDATSSWTAAVTTTAGDPITTVDPAGP